MSDDAVTSPVGVRFASTNRERVPTGVVGVPSTFVGSSGIGGSAGATAGAAAFATFDACCPRAIEGIPASTAPPTAPAAPANKSRRVMSARPDPNRQSSINAVSDAAAAAGED